jgi:IS1 family transposase
MTSETYNIGFSKNWDDVPTSTTHVLREIGNREPTLWIESIGTRTPKLMNTKDLVRINSRIKRFFNTATLKEHQLKVLSPLMLPASNSSIKHKINQYLFSYYLKREGIDKKKHLTFWSFLPNTFNLVEQQLHRSTLIYYCTDDWPLFSGLDEELIRKQENKLIAASDYLFVTGLYLQRKLSKLTEKPVHYISHGVPHALFAQAVKKDLPKPPFLTKLKPGPIIGFYGNFSNWIDHPLIRGLAKAKPDWQFVMIGPINDIITPLTDLENLHFPGRIEHHELPQWCAHFNAGFIPYDMKLEQLKSVNPIKCREMLSAGLPIVTPMMEDLEELYPDVRRATTLAEWICSLEKQCERKDRAAISERRIQDDWPRKIDSIMKIIK